MKILDSTHKRKSAVITTLFGLLLLLLFFVLGLKYLDPPISYGMEVNFGTSSQGSGPVQPKHPLAAKETPVKAVNEQPEVKETKVTPQPAQTPKVLTQEDSPVELPQEKEVTPEPVPAKKVVEEETAPPVKEQPKISEATKNVLSNLIKDKKQDTEVVAGEGTDATAGDKGNVEGNPYATSYYSNPGLGGRSSGFGLNGRNLQSNGKVVQDCNQEGTVVVRITVNQQGQVVEAVPGVKGTTNTHPCLLDPAKRTALLHKWYPDTNAPSKQVGFVVIQFKLGE